MAGHIYRDGVITHEGIAQDPNTLAVELRLEMERTKGHGTKWACLAAALLDQLEAKSPPAELATLPDYMQPESDRGYDTDTPAWVKETPRCPTNGKRRFRSKVAALASNRGNQQRLRAYVCDQCHDWHVAKNGR